MYLDLLTFRYLCWKSRIVFSCCFCSEL